MNASERYIQQVLSRVLAPEADRQRLADDLRAHFLDGQTRGDTPAQIIARLGTPNDVAEAFHLERSLVFAGFWRRWVAFIADCCVMALVALPVLMSGIWLVHQFDPSGWGRYVIGSVLVSTGLTCLGILFCYFPLLEARWGKTLGKHLLGIRVVRENGTPISLGQAFVRRLSLYFEMLVPDALFVPFTASRQRALDMLAKTVVVREPGRKVSAWAWAACFGLLFLALGGVAAAAVFRAVL